MIEPAIEPFNYIYMERAIWVSALVGGICAFLSAYLMLKGWSLMGDALAHSIVPGVVLSYILALPFAIGAFFAGLLAAMSMAIVKKRTKLREDAVIGLVFTAFFAAGLLLISIRPISVNIQSIIFGNILAISKYDINQVSAISIVCLFVLLLTWKDLMVVFFDEEHARSVGVRVTGMKILFFTLLSAACVAAIQTVGAILVIATVITPGATAYLLTDKFSRLIIIAILLGSVTNGIGAYASFFFDTHPGGLIVTLQTIVFLCVFLLAPKYGFLKRLRSSNG